MMPLRDRLEVAGVSIPCYVGRGSAGLPADDEQQIINRDRLVVITEPGVLPAAVSADATTPAKVTYQGKTWDPLTTQLTHQRHGRPHHVSVVIGRTT